MGSTQAKSAGEPEYSIWSYSVVCIGEIEKIILWSVTTVPVWDVGRTKHPPHAFASRAAAAMRASPLANAAVRTSARITHLRSHPDEHLPCPRLGRPKFRSNRGTNVRAAPP